jgi:alkanal monooxygenase alpha chain
MTAGYVLGATSTIKVGTAIAVAPFEHPAGIAENVALLDQSSKDRLRLGPTRTSSDWQARSSPR